MLVMEEDKIRHKERVIHEMEQEKEQLRQGFDDQLGHKSMDYDNIKRGYDELSYECENLRRTLSSKQEEILSLSHQQQDLNMNREQLLDKIHEMEQVITDVEDKNKKLVDLLNANLYNKAE